MLTAACCRNAALFAVPEALSCVPIDVPNAMALKLMPPDGDGGPEMPQKPCGVHACTVGRLERPEVHTTRRADEQNVTCPTCDAVAWNFPNAEEAKDVVDAICREIPICLTICIGDCVGYKHADGVLQ
jgi:hypothetical protein